MNKGELLKQLIRKKRVILIVGFVFAILSYLATKTVTPKYTSKATIYPLTNTANIGAAGALSGLLGASGASNSFSADASLNILELALSRSVSEKIASTRLNDPRFGNKTITELLVNEYNKHVFFSSKKGVPSDSASAAVAGGMLVSADVVAKINKNGVLELNYSNTDSTLVTPISNVLIAVISEFYIDLKIRKALVDYKFTLKKIDSLKEEIKAVDSKAESFQNGTYFTPPAKLLYQLPQDNLTNDKLRLESQQNMLIANKENALWTLQKATPIIATLDHPNPPFDKNAPSGALFGILGFILGMIIGAALVTRKILVRFAKEELVKMME